MQELDWNDLRYVLWLSRTGQIAGTARKLGVDETTVARRLKSIETQLRVRLFERHTGRLRPTDSGQIVIGRAERIELEVEAVKDGVTSADAVAVGKVRITATPLVMNYILIPSLPALMQLQPQLQIELVADPRNLSIINREADVAVRMARPEREQRAVARHIGRIDYAVYGTATSRPLPWITYDADLSNLPHVRWMAKAIEADPQAEIALVVNDSDLALNAVRAGLGRSLMPCRVGDAVPGICRLSDQRPVLSRDMWAIVHPDLKHLARVRAVMAWCEQLFSRSPADDKECQRS
jgi:DNA-binding transcriptional LysR family regulator